MHEQDKMKRLKQVLTYLKGQPVMAPATVTGNGLRNQLALPDNRMLVLRPASGGTPRILRGNEVVQVDEGDEFDDLPVGTWG